ncbi:YetF domain-containing protein [Pseudomonas tremae]|uniref:DUF421 domain-containing protein n=2 Tax=Pseudomonas syringae group TaxID=136849 RepID=A0AAE6QLC5_9PSED|nr:MULTISPECIES: YetF domain-containing protein [Pseudomonas syringae group]MCF5744853.1 DUF421 domain-containing protein [Pseudomonas tremae]MCF5805758.1 DUF421 domain-containing protein [Pseudomonas tremae]MCF5810403.1 DUF421 domain-containing protein [Pseudomonas tremae]QGT83663.1 DUF421 domain-containing protein [Pseudomonas coronafaciens pv. coronafaciens]UQB37337.1 DUF421 domain-containing protein [Pseudomonas tremae]
MLRIIKDVRITEADIMEAARTTQGIVEMKDIKYAFIERNGAISIIPAT